MNTTRSGSAEFPQPQQPQNQVAVDSDDALFALIPDTVSAVRPEFVPHTADEKPVSQAWAELGSREPFVLPRGLARESLNALHIISPNPQTERAIRRDDIDQHYGLMGDVVLTDEERNNLHMATKQGQLDRIARNIAGGMSEEEAIAREMIRATRLGKDPSEISL